MTLDEPDTGGCALGIVGGIHRTSANRCGGEGGLQQAGESRELALTVGTRLGGARWVRDPGDLSGHFTGLLLGQDGHHR